MTSRPQTAQHRTIWFLWSQFFRPARWL